MHKDEGYYLVEFSYDYDNFIIHLRDIETDDQYIKEIPSKEARALLRYYDNDYDKFASYILVKGNQITIMKTQKLITNSKSRLILTLNSFLIFLTRFESLTIEDLISRNIDPLEKPITYLKRLKLKSMVNFYFYKNSL